MSTRLADRAPTHGDFLVRGIGPQGLGFTPTLVNDLDRRGVPVKVDRHLDYQYGPQRVMAAADARTIWLITERGWIGSRLRAIPGGRVVYASTGLAPAQERELQRAQLTLLAQLRTAKKGAVANSLDSQLIALLVAKIRGVDQPLARRVATLDARSARARGLSMRRRGLRPPRRAHASGHRAGERVVVVDGAPRLSAARRARRPPRTAIR